MTLIMLWLLVACSDDFADPSREFGPAVPDDAVEHPVSIHTPPGLGLADIEATDVRGRPLGVPCATCHGPNPAQSWQARDDAPQDMHANVELVHGPLTCDSCHESTDRTRLHLADGSTTDIQGAMTLCAQCHGIQYREYQHGAHGGMNGHWDLRRGARDRNNCVDCHAPHNPVYGGMMPTLPPRDRYLEAEPEHEESD